VNAIVVSAVGDIGPRREKPDSIFAGLDGALGGDMVFGQMECVISERGTPAPNARLPMRTAPDVVPALSAAGFTVMSVAGNHAMDFGGEALCDTLAALREGGIAACGAGVNIAQAREPALVRAGARSVAFLAYSSILPAGYAADSNRPGCAPLRVHTQYEAIEHDQPGTPPRILTFAFPEDLAALHADIRSAREQADHVLVSMHWGVHFIRAVLADYQREVGRAIIEAGADAVIGHHPHLLKAVEFHRGRPIIHSLGNFAIEQPSAFMENLAEDSGFRDIRRLNDGWRPKERYMNPAETRHTAVARLTLGTGAYELTMLPFRIDDDSVPRRLEAGTPEFDDVLEYLRSITIEAGVATVYEGDESGGIRVAPGP